MNDVILKIHKMIDRSKVNHRMPVFHYWDRVLKEIAHQDDRSYWFCFTNVGFKEEPEVKHKISTRRDKYYLIQKDDGVYFTRREAECMVCLLSIHKKNRMNAVAERLGIAPRTSEQLVKYLKNKTNTTSIDTLIEVVKQTGFMVYVNTICKELKIVAKNGS